MSPSLAWVDGGLVPRDEARVSIDDFGYRYGLACFETMLARHGRVFRLGQHLDRLDAALRLFRAAPPPRDELVSAVEETLHANGLTEASVRLSVTPGRGMRPALPAAGPPTVTVTADPVPAGQPRGRLWVTRVRIDAARPWRGAKVAQFAPYLLARAEAEDEGFEDALLLDHAGRIAEASTANVFFVIDGGLVTPSLDAGALPGVTRACVIEVAAARGQPVWEADLTLDDLARATAGFLTSSIAGVAPMTSVAWEVDGRRHQWSPSDAGGAGVMATVAGAYEVLVERETR